VIIDDDGIVRPTTLGNSSLANGAVVLIVTAYRRTIDSCHTAPGCWLSVDEDVHMLAGAIS